MKESKCDKNTCQRYKVLTLICSEEEIENFYCKVCPTLTPDEQNTDAQYDSPFSIYDMYSD